MLSPSHSPQSYGVMQVLLGLIALLCSTSVVKNGIKKLFQLKADCDSMAALALLSSMVAAIACVAKPEMLAEGKVHIYVRWAAHDAM